MLLWCLPGRRLPQLREVLPRVDVVKIVANAPNLLVYDIKTSIPPKLVSLKRLLPGKRPDSDQPGRQGGRHDEAGTATGT